MQSASHNLSAARQEPNRSGGHAGDKTRVSEALPVPATVFYFQSLDEAEKEHDRREEQYREFYEHEDACEEAGHVSSKSHQHATNRETLILPLIRPVDVILIMSITALGLFVMAVALGRI